MNDDISDFVYLGDITDESTDEELTDNEESTDEEFEYDDHVTPYSLRPILVPLCNRLFTPETKSIWVPVLTNVACVASLTIVCGTISLMV